MDYAYAYDGDGGQMRYHYDKKPGYVTNNSKTFSADGNKWIPVVYKVPELKDDYSSGICPGFTLPNK